MRANSTPRYRLRDDRLREAAAAKGDHTTYAIAKRAGLNQTSLSRVRRGISEPATPTLMALGEAYGIPVERLVEKQETAI